MKKQMEEPREEEIVGSGSATIEAPKFPWKQPGSSIAGEGEIVEVGDIE